MARDKPSYESSQDRHKPQPGQPQGREAGARRAERENRAEENEKKDWKPGAPDIASRKRTAHQAENTSSPQANLDNRHKGAQPTDRNLDRVSWPQLTSQKSNRSRRIQEEPPLTEHGGRRGGKGRTPEEH